MRAIFPIDCAFRILSVRLLAITVSLLGITSTSAQSSGVAAPTVESKSRSKDSHRDEFSGKILADPDMTKRMIRHRLFNAPRVGEKAPSFTLSTADGTKQVSLSQLHEKKPVVLILSSWGCDIFRETLGGLHSLYSSYNNRAEFAMIYIREAHPFNSDSPSLGRINDLNEMQDRMATARRCRQQMRLPFTVLCDSIDDPVTTRWAAWPVRIFVVDTDGKISYAGAQGPWGYRPYAGFLHGDGAALVSDEYYSKESLEEFLKTKFGAPAAAKESSEVTQVSAPK